MKTIKDNYVTDCAYVVYIENELSYCDRPDGVWSRTKTNQNNDMTDPIGLVYVETESELLGLSD